MSALKELLTQPVGLLGVAAGSGQVARAAVEAGADILFALNAGPFRHLGTGSLAAFLPYANANHQTEVLLREHLLPQAREVPIVAGVFANDPTLDVDERLERLQALGVAGVVNWPAIGFIDGGYRAALEAAGVGVEGEADMLARAKKLGLGTFGFALDTAAALRFADAGADALILDLGLTRQIEDIRTRQDQLQHAIMHLNRMLHSLGPAGRARPCLAFGGPITTPEDLEELFRQSLVQGFAGGSVFERLPVHGIVASTVRRFKGVLRHGPLSEGGLGQLLGRSPPMRELFNLIARVAPFDVNVCIEGETGTGKELVAAQIHRLSPRVHGPFVTLNCGAIPDTLLESELFGHEKGAFTGADRRRPGKFELAHQGTLLLDEIPTLSPRGQAALLRVLQQREITRVGGDASLAVDVRVLAASNEALAEKVKAGGFRSDLYYRLNAMTLHLPPLRERADDLPLLVGDILARLQGQLNKTLSGLSARFEAKLRQHVWPGNVRELQHVLGQAALREDGPLLEGAHFEPEVVGPVTPQSRREQAESALRAARGNKSRAAADLGVTRKTLYAWLAGAAK
jgi:two-component system response regulator HydG